MGRQARTFPWSCMAGSALDDRLYLVLDSGLRSAQMGSDGLYHFDADQVLDLPGYQEWENADQLCEQYVFA